uniref:AlNc14C285G10169 protein n=1 Tax=Albugo laibachii Nc14 TaxID=890382 RepID=F0WV23_9STRA|nr:AlNc14C285G10169 [Albugo laibachii Nc14]|eukprot:CCA25260.1 AlNc14C285G10169 [Albugo laibachii Nc14]
MKIAFVNYSPLLRPVFFEQAEVHLFNWQEKGKANGVKDIHSVIVKPLAHESHKGKWQCSNRAGCLD